MTSEELHGQRSTVQGLLDAEQAAILQRTDEARKLNLANYASIDALRRYRARIAELDAQIMDVAEQG